MPEPNESWLPVTKDQWHTFWGSQIAGTMVDQAHIGPLFRYFDFVDEWHFLSTIFRNEPVTLGSAGQEVVNPLHKRMEHLEKQLVVLEDRFGMNPQALLSAGVKFGEVSKSLKDRAQDVVKVAFEDPRQKADKTQTS